jgi:transcriptional regulator with XRE-family HTH domain
VNDLVMESLGARLRDVRIRSGVGLRELARKAEVSPSYISQIENGKTQPSITSLYAFARILNAPISDLFVDEPAEPPAPTAAAESAASGDATGELDPSHVWNPTEFANRISVIHPSHRSRLDFSDGVVWERLAATPERSISYMKITYQPRASGKLQSHDGYEYGYVLRGALSLRVGTEEFLLREGESVGFDSTIPHVLTNATDDVFEGLWFVHGRSH